LAGVDCELSAKDPGNAKKMAENEWFNGGCHSRFCWNDYQYSKNPSKVIAIYEGHCKEAKADTVFMFLTAVVMIVCALLVWLRMRRGY